MIGKGLESELKGIVKTAFKLLKVPQVANDATALRLPLIIVGKVSIPLRVLTSAYNHHSQNAVRLPHTKKAGIRL